MAEVLPIDKLPRGLHSQLRRLFYALAEEVHPVQGDASLVRRGPYHYHRDHADRIDQVLEWCVQQGVRVYTPVLHVLAQCLGYSHRQATLRLWLQQVDRGGRWDNENTLSWIQATFGLTALPRGVVPADPAPEEAHDETPKPRTGPITDDDLRRFQYLLRWMDVHALPTNSQFALDHHMVHLGFNDIYFHDVGTEEREKELLELLAYFRDRHLDVGAAIAAQYGATQALGATRTVGTASFRETVSGLLRLSPQTLRGLLETYRDVEQANSPHFGGYLQTRLRNYEKSVEAIPETASHEKMDTVATHDLRWYNDYALELYALEVLKRDYRYFGHAPEGYVRLWERIHLPFAQAERLRAVCVILRQRKNPFFDGLYIRLNEGGWVPTLEKHLNHYTLENRRLAETDGPVHGNDKDLVWGELFAPLIPHREADLMYEFSILHETPLERLRHLESVQLEHYALELLHRGIFSSAVPSSAVRIDNGHYVAASFAPRLRRIHAIFNQRNNPFFDGLLIHLNQQDKGWTSRLAELSRRYDAQPPVRFGEKEDVTIPPERQAWGDLFDVTNAPPLRGNAEGIIEEATMTTKQLFDPYTPLQQSLSSYATEQLQQRALALLAKNLPDDPSTKAASATHVGFGSEGHLPIEVAVQLDKVRLELERRGYHFVDAVLLMLESSTSTQPWPALCADWLRHFDLYTVKNRLGANDKGRVYSRHWRLTSPLPEDTVDTVERADLQAAIKTLFNALEARPASSLPRADEIQVTRPLTAETGAAAVFTLRREDLGDLIRLRRVLRERNNYFFEHFDRLLSQHPKHIFHLLEQLKNHNAQGGSLNDVCHVIHTPGTDQVEAIINYGLHEPLLRIGTWGGALEIPRDAPTEDLETKEPMIKAGEGESTNASVSFSERSWMKEVVFLLRNHLYQTNEDSTPSFPAELIYTDSSTYKLWIASPAVARLRVARRQLEEKNQNYLLQHLFREFASFPGEIHAILHATGVELDQSNAACMDLRFQGAEGPIQMRLPLREAPHCSSLSYWNDLLIRDEPTTPTIPTDSKETLMTTAAPKTAESSPTRARKLARTGVRRAKQVGPIVLGRQLTKATEAILVAIFSQKFGGDKRKILKFLRAPEGVALVKLVLGGALSALPMAQYAEDLSTHEYVPANMLAVVADALQVDALADGADLLADPLFKGMGELIGMITSLSNQPASLEEATATRVASSEGIGVKVPVG